DVKGVSSVGHKGAPVASWTKERSSPPAHGRADALGREVTLRLVSSLASQNVSKNLKKARLSLLSRHCFRGLTRAFSSAQVVRRRWRRHASPRVLPGTQAPRAAGSGPLLRGCGSRPPMKKTTPETEVTLHTLEQPTDRAPSQPRSTEAPGLRRVSFPIGL